MVGRRPGRKGPQMGSTASEVTQGETRPEEVRPSERFSRETRRLLPVIAPVVFGATFAVVIATSSLVAFEPSTAELAGLTALLIAATFVEAFPVPIENVPVGGTSLATVFIVGTASLYGWAAAVLVGFLTQLLVEVGRRQRPIRIAYNSSVYALSATAAGAVAAAAPNDGFGLLALEIGLAATAFYAVNLPLVAVVVSRWAREPFLALLRRAVSSTAIAFAIMASLSLMLAVLWDRSPFLSAALVGPLAAIALYQRSVHRELRAMRLALTDPLTGLGNHRHFHERLEADLAAADERDAALSLCVLDLDNFKEINDRFGHPAGDRVLAQVAGRLRQDGEAFRIGGDEFALLLADQREDEAVTIVAGVLERIRGLEPLPRVTVALSAGIATYPHAGIGRAELLQAADRALYLAKEQSPGGLRTFRPELEELAELNRLATGPDRGARLRAAASLAHAVDARDAYTGSHSYMVGELAARVAGLMELQPEEVELLRLAGSLHDLGKLAIPEEILRKPGLLNEAERLVLERHPQIGFRMLESLGIDPVATWVLHHHERWDGGGYPHRLGGEEIPLGSRILFVADAYDAMTSERVYRGRISHEQAVAELERCSATQFDPRVVALFVDRLKRSELVALKSA
jgi:diguanylate cyclase (GGDEF)-like protein/putative nucleotidyltransferase with HDIG domain